MTSHDELAVARAQVNEFLRSQTPSIEYFWNATHRIFYRTARDREAEDLAGAETNKVGRLTSTVTCIESLLEAPDWFRATGNWEADKPKVELQDFLTRAPLTSVAGWQSDEAAWVYCRVRTLGASLRLLDRGSAWTTDEKKIAAKLLKQAWSSKHNAGGAFGLRESTKDPENHDDIGAESTDRQYPANAFLTYWGLLAADLSTELFPNGGEHPIDDEQRAAAVDWMTANLAAQVTFHYNESHHADPQQLAWSLCAHVRFGDGRALANETSVEHELLMAGLKAFFDQQHPDGDWAVGAPLFHYRNAGNAYAYIYETLGELLSLATSLEVERPASTALRDALSAYRPQLLLALGHAERTAQHLDDDRDEIVGWSSGHHPHRNSPECWATASVFRFAQALRRLIGIWSCDEAKRALGARRPSANDETLRDRGETWDIGNGTAGGFLATAYVQPVLRVVEKGNQKARFLPDPDERILEEKQARSAMLFGPPGTGKTKLVEAVAGAIGWDFIEITPAQFLDHGVESVSARADAIFRQVMELDHCVILLDEIDELIRRRSEDAETLERFFTTTMLPRLAKLWDNRRVLFFVNTNNIKKVDSAVVRSQRFDAAMIVLPPSLKKKAAMLEAKGIKIEATAEHVMNALNAEKTAPEALGIGWLALVRHDQMDSLINSLQEYAGTNQPVSNDALAAGLVKLSGELARLDWSDNYTDAEEKQAEPKAPINGGCWPLPKVKSQFEAERRDSRIRLYAKLDDEITTDQVKDIETIGNDRWVRMVGAESPEDWAQDKGLVLTTDGVLHPPSNG